MGVKGLFREKDGSRTECELQVSVESQGSLYNLFALRIILWFEGLYLVEALKKKNIY